MQSPENKFETPLTAETPGPVSDRTAAARAEEPAPAIEEVPLTIVENGARVFITSFACERGPACRLVAMGLVEGDEIEVAQNTFGGPVTVRRNNTRLALGYDLAHRIYVSRRAPARVGRAIPA